jgi:hypothetical protein
VSRSQRGFAPSRLHYHHPQRVHDRWMGETLRNMPVVSYAERHAPGATFPHPREVAYIAERRALLPESVREWMAGKEVAAKAEASVQTSGETEPDRPSMPAPTGPRRPPASNPTPARTDEERRQRKLEQTRASNARKRAERKAAGLPHL